MRSLAAELVDGITATYSNRWVHNYNYPGTNPRPAWVEMDLDGYYNLYFADVFTGWGTEGNQLAKYELQYLDGDEWKTIPGASVSGNTELYNYIDFETPVCTNKVRLYIDDTEAKIIRLNEVRLFGIKTNETPGEINVALNKSVTAGAASSVDSGSAPENADITSELTFTEPIVTTKVKFISTYNAFRISEIEIYGIEVPKEEIGTKWTVTTDSVRCTRVNRKYRRYFKELFLSCC